MLGRRRGQAPLPSPGPLCLAGSSRSSAVRAVVMIARPRVRPSVRPSVRPFGWRTWRTWLASYQLSGALPHPDGGRHRVAGSGDRAHMPPAVPGARLRRHHRGACARCAHRAARPPRRRCATQEPAAPMFTVVPLPGPAPARPRARARVVRVIHPGVPFLRRGPGRERGLRRVPYHAAAGAD